MVMFRVFFDQINRTYYDVDAGDAIDAKTKARRLYREEFETPDITAVQRI